MATSRVDLAPKHKRFARKRRTDRKADGRPISPRKSAKNSRHGEGLGLHLRRLQDRILSYSPGSMLRLLKELVQEPNQWSRLSIGRLEHQNCSSGDIPEADYRCILPDTLLRWSP
jgi:hypothetical protein